MVKYQRFEVLEGSVTHTFKTLGPAKLLARKLKTVVWGIDGNNMDVVWGPK